ncbi:MAG TPA: hypothetical protein VGE24_06100, partial [Emticicia sp.]
MVKVRMLYMLFRKPGLLIMFFLPLLLNAQKTFPVNGVAEPRGEHYAFVHATIIDPSGKKLEDASMVIREGKVVAVGKNISIPKDAVLIDARNKFIYPSFIDAYSDYGIPIPTRTGQFNYYAPAQLESNTKGAYGWN